MVAGAVEERGQTRTVRHLSRDGASILVVRQSKAVKQKTAAILKVVAALLRSRLAVFDLSMTGLVPLFGWFVPEQPVPNKHGHGVTGAET